MSRLLYLRCVFWELRRGGPRVLLAAGAVALAVAVAVIATALGEGARGELHAAGAAERDMFMVKAALMPPRPGRGGGWAPSTRLSPEDADLLRASLPGVVSVVPVAGTERRVALAGRGYVVPVRGATPDYARLRKLALAAGRALDTADEAAAARVAVIGAGVARRLGDGQPLTGARIRIAGLPFEVVGQLAPRGLTAASGNEDDLVLVPLSTARHRLLNRFFLDNLLVRMAPGTDLLAARAGTLSLLRQAHGLRPGQRNEAETLAMLRSGAIQARRAQLLAGLSNLFVAVSAALGAAGVLAATWLSVTQRRAEIGLRLALGATRWQIALQILLESGVLSLIGGALGVLAATLALAVLPALTGWMAAPDGAIVGWALPLAVLSAMAAGGVPALKAAAVMPVDALKGV
ncbi:MAG TPA: ABC transporter permease [Azospirillaceae bacterium]|nr:ABC transporter permease [Azospirillaceae bacterium]